MMFVFIWFDLSSWCVCVPFTFHLLNSIFVFLQINLPSGLISSLDNAISDGKLLSRDRSPEDFGSRKFPEVYNLLIYVVFAQELNVSVTVAFFIICTRNSVSFRMKCIVYVCVIADICSNESAWCRTTTSRDCCGENWFLLAKIVGRT